MVAIYQVGVRDKMPKAEIKMRSWQVFHFVRKHLGNRLLYACFGKKNARTVDYWCQDPKYSNKPEEAWDPIKGVKLLLSSLDDNGHTGVIRSTIGYLLSGTSIPFDHRLDLVEPLKTINDEVLADYRAVADLQSAIDTNADMEEIELLKGEAIEEIERTVAKYQSLNK